MLAFIVEQACKKHCVFAAVVWSGVPSSVGAGFRFRQERRTSSPWACFVHFDLFLECQYKVLNSVLVSLKTDIRKRHQSIYGDSSVGAVTEGNTMAVSWAGTKSNSRICLLATCDAE